MKRQQKSSFDLKISLSRIGDGQTIGDFRKGDVIFAQGDPAEAVFYIHKGIVKLTVISEAGKEVVFALLGATDFFGEGCLNGQFVRMGTATAVTACSIARIDKLIMIRAIHDEPAFSEAFMAHLLCRNGRLEEDLVDQLFNPSEKRLARILLLLANFGKDNRPEAVIPKISQETLAEMVGTTRSRISFFMNKFRKLGFIEYKDGLEVHNSLLNVFLHDSPARKRPPSAEHAGLNGAVNGRYSKSLKRFPALRSN